MRVLGISGSLRRGSFNRRLLQYASRVAEQMGVAIEVLDIAGLPLFNEDLECGELSPHITAFREQLLGADGVVICTPEYNSSIPGLLKNAIDWGSRPPKNLWDSKTIAIMGATPGGLGTVNAQRDLRHVLSALNANVIPYPNVYVSRASEAFNSDGELISNSTRQNAAQLLGRLFAASDTERCLARMS